MESVAVISPDVRMLELKLLLKSDVRTGFVVSQRRCRITEKLSAGSWIAEPVKGYVKSCTEGDSFKMLGLGSSKVNTHQWVLTFEF
jgi:hypothetical protein